ncbi:hypothetical protein [Streptomyces sp. NPDC053560]|uniref:hypothetical protein n=1 Tax=Streptomyces sp. NPDC053560 TaxID=3365711 RepID=UPI0037CDA135
MQNIEIPRETAPGHHYLLSGLLLGSLCRRRMDGTWSSHRAAYRCRHGHNSASPSITTRPPNAYIREDRILPHLPALAIRLDRPPHEPARIASRLRTDKITLTYDPKDETLATSTPTAERIYID